MSLLAYELSVRELPSAVKCSTIAEFLDRKCLDPYLALYGLPLAQWTLDETLVIKRRERLPKGRQISREYNDFVREVKRRNINTVLV